MLKPAALDVSDPKRGRSVLSSTKKETSMRPILIAATSALALLVGPASAQTTKEREPPLSDDEKKPQQNSADEAAVRGRLEDGIKPGDPSAQTEANKKVEDAAVEAKRKSNAKKKTIVARLQQPVASM
jgi:hypothetical protein